MSIEFLSFWLYWCYNHHLKENTFFFQNWVQRSVKMCFLGRYSDTFTVWNSPFESKENTLVCSLYYLSIYFDLHVGSSPYHLYETSTKNGKFNKFVVLKPLRETHLPFIDLKSLKQTVYCLMKKEVSIK